MGGLESEQTSFIFKDLQNSFLSGLEGRFGVLEKALTMFCNSAGTVDVRDALTQLHGNAHRLGGTASTFGALNLGRLARALESACAALLGRPGLECSGLERSGELSEQERARIARLTDSIIKIKIDQSLFDDGVAADLFEPTEAPALRESSILVLDDETVICELITGAAMAKGFAVNFVTKSDLFPLIYNSGLDVIFLDLAMPGMDGVEIIRFLAEKNSTAGLVLMSVHDDTVLHAVRDLAIDHGLVVHGILRKPIASGELAGIFEKLAKFESRAIFRNGREGSLRQVGSDELPSAADLEMAITRNELSVSYQPQIDIESNRIFGFEGLARWRHPEKGAIPPGYFIPLAEDYDLIAGLTAYIMDVVTDDVKNNPAIFENKKISVNISEKLLSDLSLPENIVSRILNKNLNPNDFTFEITENTITSNPKSALDVLTRFRLKGVTLSIDDFGTGHSSLSRLRKIPFNEIKIDQSFIENFDYDIENRIIVENTISLAKKLSLTVVAEGVEKRVHLDLLKNLGCDVGQGYFFGRPMDVDNLSAWTAAWRENE